MIYLLVFQKYIFSSHCNSVWPRGVY